MKKVLTVVRLRGCIDNNFDHHHQDQRLAPPKVVDEVVVVAT